MRWIDIELPVAGTSQKLDALLDEATILTSGISELQQHEGLDGVLVTERMAAVGRLLFQALVAGDPQAFRPQDNRAGARVPNLGPTDIDPLVGYHIVTVPPRLMLPWSWLHNGVGFLLEHHPLCSSQVSSQIPEADTPRPWMQRYSEQLFQASNGGFGHSSDRQRPPNAAVPEIFFVPGHCQEKIRRLIYREAEGIGSALAAARTSRARLHVPDVALTPRDLVTHSLLVQALHYAGPTSQPPEAGLDSDGWLTDLLADAAPSPDEQIADMTGLELDAVGIDPVDALLDRVVESYEQADTPLAPVAAAGSSASPIDAATTDPVGSGQLGSGTNTGETTTGRAGSGERARSATNDGSWLLDDGPVRPECMARDGNVPPLIFSNSYLSLPTLGARFLAAGASAFIGPVAPLYSRPARLYAARFYDFLADGLCTGAALRAAALALRDKNGAEHPAWLSYGMVGYGALALQYL